MKIFDEKQTSSRETRLEFDALGSGRCGGGFSSMTQSGHSKTFIMRRYTVPNINNVKILCCLNCDTLHYCSLDDKFCRKI